MEGQGVLFCKFCVVWCVPLGKDWLKLLFFLFNTCSRLMKVMHYSHAAKIVWFLCPVLKLNRYIQWNLSKVATLGSSWRFKPRGDHCRENNTKVNVWSVHQGKNLAIVEIYQGKYCREVAFSKTSTVLQKKEPDLTINNSASQCIWAEPSKYHTTNDKNILTLIHPSPSSQCLILLIILYLLLQALKCCLSTKVTDFYREGYWWQISTMK